MKNRYTTEGKMWYYLLLFLLCSMVFGNKVRAEEGWKLHEENFSADHDLKGLFSSCEEYFQTGNWKVENAKLTLYYTATTLVREEISDFTISLNGEPVYSQKVPLTAGETQKLVITLPEKLIKEGTNSIRIESYIRTSGEDPCEDDVSGASWMVIRRDSFVSVSYRPLTSCRNVTDVYSQLTSIEGLENQKSAVFLPEQTTEAELTCAGYILAGVAGNAVSSYDSLQLIQSEEQKKIESCTYGVYVAEYDRLPEYVMALLSENQKRAAAAEAVIAFAETKTGNKLLVVTGKDNTALENAGKLFGNPERMNQIFKNLRQVSGTENVNRIVNEDNSIRLTETGSYVSGPFKQTASFQITLGDDKTIAAGSEATIRMRYAENLDFDRSLMTVLVNDIPVGSRKLEKNSANGDLFQVDIPDNLDITGNFTLKVTFDLEMKDLICDIRKQDMPWAYVTNDSTVTLLTEERPWLLFDYYPGPFIQGGAFSDVVMLLPAEESSRDLEAMRKILLTVGRYMTDNSGILRVRRANNEVNLSGANIISIGCLGDNPIAQQLNDQLYFRFSPKGTTILSNEKMKIEAEYGAALGTAQLLYSPYSMEKRALLIVSGVTEKGMLYAADYLGEVQKNWSIYGDGFVTDGVQINCFRFGKDNNKGSSFLLELTKENGVAALMITGCCVLLLISISLLMIGYKHRKEH